MFQYFKKVLRNLKIKSDKKAAACEAHQDTAETLDKSLDENLSKIKRILGSSPDVLIREFNMGRSPDHRAAIVLIEGVSNTDLINSNILKPLMFDFLEDGDKIGKNNIEDIFNNFIPFCNTSRLSDMDGIMGSVTKGSAVLMIDGFAEALAVSAKKWEGRAIEEPMTESVIRGPRAGFSESIFTNVSLLRRIIKNPKLKFDAMQIGRQTNTDVLVAYIDGIANPSVIREVKKRLSEIVVDSVLDSSYIEAYIQDSPYSIFPTVGNSERPDVISSRLLEGRVAILADGSPFVLTVPMLFIENFQTTQDYNLKFYYASFMRILRYFSFGIATLAPALYVALTTFHQELIPTTLLFTMSAGHENIPFPATVEVFLMLFFFDIMFEAGLRLPKVVGSAVSIVGALVLGESAVAAGLISPFMVIVVALTAITSFVVAPQSYTALILRHVFTLLGGLLGGFGLLLGFIILLFHLYSIQSFGVLYMAPLNTISSNDYEDTLVVFPAWKMRFRPQSFSSPNRRRRAGDPPASDND